MVVTSRSGTAPPSPVAEYATARLLARVAGLVYRLFILRLFRGECSVSALPGWVLVRRRDVLAERLLLLVVSLFVFFETGPPTRESADTTVPTAVPTFCATSVKTPPSTDVNLPFDRLPCFIRNPPQLGHFDATSLTQVAS
jgi:hypothetical protein